MAYEDYLIREANEGPPADWSDSPVEWCNECERALELCVCEKYTAHNDRQDLINNLPAVPVLAEPKRQREDTVGCETTGSERITTECGAARESTTSGGLPATDSRGGRQSNLSGGGEGSTQPLLAAASVAQADASADARSEAQGSAPPSQTLPDTWEAIAAQLDYWSDMDREYWRQRREKAYDAWFDRTYGV